jgi:hypothetical protein
VVDQLGDEAADRAVRPGVRDGALGDDALIGADADQSQAQLIIVAAGRLEKLAEYEKVETVNSDVDPDANLVYMTDFDLGDLCTYRYTDVGIETTKRITEIQEVYEGSKQTLSVVFGNDMATSITKIIKREAS